MKSMTSRSRLVKGEVARFAINEAKRRHPDGCLECGAIGP